MAVAQDVAPNDWFEHLELLPPRPVAFTEHKFTRRFALDLNGQKNHDQYVFLSPNGLAVIGLAPSHPLIAAHRTATGYKPTELRYIPPKLDHLKAEDLVSAMPDEDGAEGAEAVTGSVSAGAAAADVSGSGMDLGEAPAPAPAASTAAAAGASREGEGAGAGGQGRGGPACGSGTSGGGGGGQGRRGGGGEGAGAASKGQGRPAAPQCEPFPPEQCARINFEGGTGRNLAATKASGKKRGRGAQILRGRTVLAQVERSGGGPSFPIHCVVNGQLLECNERLIKTPRLLYDRPCREGYVAILSPGPEALKYVHSNLVSEQEYLRLRGLTAEDLL